MARRSRRSAPRRSYSRRRSHRRGHKGFIAQTTGAVRKIGYGMVRVAGPLMMGAGGLVLAAPIVEGTVQQMQSHSLSSAQATFKNAAGDVTGNLPTAAILIGGGLIVTKIVGSVLKG